MSDKCEMVGPPLEDLAGETIVPLTREQILEQPNANEYAPEVVDIPDWRGSVCVRVVSGTERDNFEASLKGNKKLRNFRARFCALVVCDANGQKLFDVADLELLGKKHAGALDTILEAGLRVNKMTDADVDELEGN